ncbi:hypothetical protein QYF36_019797 [Acer negundo]|nr:hypothetical protein QYF36_019797 [Acer negundo]
MGETTTVDSMDRLSALPPFINHHIMSRLIVKEAAQTSILSKRWKVLYTSFPVLDFHESYTYFMRLKNLSKFIKFVDAFLVRFCELKISMQKFRLLIGLLDVKQLSSVLDRWYASVTNMPYSIMLKLLLASKS